MTEHLHDFDIHYTSTDWQHPTFIKCEGCGSTFYLARPVVLRAVERLANAAEDILFVEFSTEDMDELRSAWQAYVDVAPDEDDTDGAVR